MFQSAPGPAGGGSAGADRSPTGSGAVVRVGAVNQGPWQHRDVSANGIRFHLAEQGSGPLIVLVHDFGQYWRSWRYQLPGLAAAGYRVVAPDLRGYGDTDKAPRGYDAFCLAADLSGLIRALGERQAILVGQGFGGITAFNTAAMHPDQVAGLVVLGAPHPLRMAKIGRPWPADRARRLVTWAGTPVWPERHLLSGRAALLERIVRSFSGPAWRGSRDFRVTVEQMRAAIRIPGAAHGAVEHLRWMARSPWRADGHRHRDAIAQPLTLPVLHLVGDADRFTPPDSLAPTREMCRGWYTLSTVRGVGHYPAEEAPELTTELIAGLAARAHR
ncbi:alpha/beta hydrolase [Nakamurella flava]|uniref:Alpha/beta hydrolase n=1 Tax=Nakamurella flava TaxID=2576308 RepID=A0A4U6QEF2_9ACTN|nr:alpha/beta hydrolase [Nakamurella flava]